MGQRECFIYSTKNKHTVEKLAEKLVGSHGFKGEFPPFWLVCKSVAVADIHKDSAVVFGQKQDIDPIDFKCGQEFLCIGYESGNSVKDCLPFNIKKDLVVIESWMLGDLNYPDILRDEPIEVGGQVYFAELKGEEKGDSVTDLISDATVKAEQAQAKDIIDAPSLEI